MTTIAICSSANFYRQAVDIQSELNLLGIRVVIPASGEKMKQSGDFDASKYRTWFNDKEDYQKKTALMRGHFSEIAKADAILVLNYEKNSKPNYIGGNVLIEMGVALYLEKPIFILNEAPEESSYLEEILGMQPIFLHGDIKQLPEKYIDLLADKSGED